mgnify:CR=1 FL=1
MSHKLTPPHFLLYEDVIRRALREDLGEAGDLTTEAVVPPNLEVRALISTRSAGRIAGVDVATSVFRLLDPEIEPLVKLYDGSDAQSNDLVVAFHGQARALLSGERSALNILGHLCGIATATREVVEAVRETSVKVVCTRKTHPGLRTLEKYAVRVGGGFNHRFGLDDAVLIKDNHLALSGGVRQAVESVRKTIGHTLKIEVEVGTLEQLEEAIELKVDAVLLDNMTPVQVEAAVRMANRRVVLEVSGGITKENAARLAASGVDILSVGWLTHSAPALDLACELVAS